MMNMKLLAVVTPMCIYKVYSNQEQYKEQQLGFSLGYDKSEFCSVSTQQ